MFKYALLAVVALFISAAAQDKAQEDPYVPFFSDTKPVPDHQNVSYGPHERNLLDLWKAEADEPTPVAVFFHGGGFVRGDKWTLDPHLLEECLKAGISVCTAEYRRSVDEPFPGPMLDGARVIQFLRYKAKDWGLNSKRVAAMGTSAGAGISLWIGYHDDLADPASDDPILRESTRLTCMAVFGAQCSYDPRFIREVIGGRAYEAKGLPLLYGIEEQQIDDPAMFPKYEAAAPINYVDKDDPPAIMYYTEPKAPLKPGPNTGAALYYENYGKEIEGHDKPGWGIHHPRFGEVLKAKVESVGGTCIVRHAEDYPGEDEPLEGFNRELVEFLIHYFFMT